MSKYSIKNYVFYRDSQGEEIFNFNICKDIINFELQKELVWEDGNTIIEYKDNKYIVTGMSLGFYGYRIEAIKIKSINLKNDEIWEEKSSNFNALKKQEWKQIYELEFVENKPKLYGKEVVDFFVVKDKNKSNKVCFANYEMKNLNDTDTEFLLEEWNKRNNKFTKEYSHGNLYSFEDK